MDNTISHLMLNHLPQILPIIGFILLLIGVFTPSEVVKRTSYVFFILGGILGILPNFFLGNSILSNYNSLALSALGVMSAISLFASLKNLKFSRFAPLFVAGIAVFTLFFAQNLDNFNLKNQNTISKNTDTPKTLENLIDANSSATRSSENITIPNENISNQQITQNVTSETPVVDANSGATKSTNNLKFDFKQNAQPDQKIAQNTPQIDANSSATRSENSGNQLRNRFSYAKNHHREHFEEEDDED